MYRRKYLTATGLVTSVFLSGCLSETGSEADIETRKTLGEGPQVSMNVDSDERYGGSRYGVDDRSYFERWATHEVANLASSRLRQVLTRKGLIGENVSTGVSFSVSLDEYEQASTEDNNESKFEKDLDAAPTVFYFHHLSRSGRVLSKPDVPFEDVVKETPRSFEIDATFGQRTYKVVLPTLCNKDIMKNQ